MIIEDDIFVPQLHRKNERQCGVELKRGQAFPGGSFDVQKDSEKVLIFLLTNIGNCSRAEQH
jgi:hypothetical protein